MKTSAGTLRTTVYLLSVLLISAGLASCGGGGGGSTPGTSGPATVRVSIASATSFPAGTTIESSTLSPTIAAPPEDSPTFEHLDVTVTKLALIPSTGEDKSVTDTFKPIQIDLLHLPGDNVAMLLNQFSGVPAGEYSKIRVYYDNVVGRSGNDNTLFHPTANSHFDVHFVGGNLVIPVTSEIHPQGGIRFYSVEINVVDGLKHHEAGNSGNFLLRPQVFAEVVSAPVYIVSGVAQNVQPADNTFDIDTGGTIVTADYSATNEWIYSDNTTVGLIRKSSLADLGASGLDNGAIVEVIGTFSSDNVLLAQKVDITFPDVLKGDVYLTWKSDNTFDLRIPAEDNTVFPRPSRTTAYYDNAVDFTQLSDASIVDNAAIIARGYNQTGGIGAFWISIGP